MQDNQAQTSSDEIDLGVVFDKIKSLFKSLLLGVVMVFRFFWKHKIRLFILLIIGIGLQFFLVKQLDKIYTNELLVKTNFESTEYLYSKVKSINAKLKSKDTLYLKKVFGEGYDRIKGLEVTPVVDVYNLVNKSEENREIFELLLDEYGGISFLEEEININEYPTHKIRVFIKGIENNESIAGNLYSFLSDNSYYNSLKGIALENYKEQLEQNKAIRTQIDSIIKDQRENGMMPKLNNNAISFEGSQNLNELLNQKKELLSNDLFLRNQLSSEDEVLKTIDSSFGVLSEEKNIPFYIVSLLFVLVYCLYYLIKFIHNKITEFVKINNQ